MLSCQTILSKRDEGLLVTLSESFRLLVYHVRFDSKRQLYPCSQQCSFRSVVNAGEDGRSVIRPCDSSPPRCVAESARCPQAFSRLQDSQSYHIIYHYQNVTSWSTSMVRLMHILSRTERYATSCWYQQSISTIFRSIYLLTAPSRHGRHSAYSQGQHLWTYTSLWFQKPTTHRLDHSTAPSPEVTSVTVCSPQ